MPGTTQPRARHASACRLLAGAILTFLLLLASLGAGTAGAAIAGAVVTSTTPPKVTKNPASVTVEEGQPASFTAAASGSPTPTVQWEVSTNGGTSFSPIEGATSTTYTIAATSTSENGYQFRAVFTNIAGTVTSKAATLTVRKVPVVTLQPASQTVLEGQNAVFEAAASGTPAPTVQWQQSTNAGGTWSNISGATSTVLTVAQVKASQNGNEYRAVFKNLAGSATTEAAVLTVQRAPSVTKQPASTTVEAGQAAAFEATGSGLPAPTTQWEVSTDGGNTWNPIEGATGSILVIPETTVAEDGYQYRALFSNAAGTATTSAATLHVHIRVLVTQQPQSVIVQAGEEASFETAGQGFPVPSVQWERSTNNGSTWTPIEGATSDQLALGVTTLEENGYEYRAVFRNGAESATSNAARLTVASHNYTALAWGDNFDRQLGTGSTLLSSDLPAPVSGLTFVTAVAGGGRHSLALRADGTVVGWGSDEYGQLGNGEAETDVPFPVAVPGLSGVKAIAAGRDHSLALLANGTVMAWGENEAGQLGDGTTVAKHSPVAVKSLTGVRAIAAGGNTSMALLSNGTVMAWGDNSSGQLGVGTLTNHATPVAVKGISGATGIAVGEGFALALLSSGSVEAWGDDAFEELANAGIEEAQSTVPVPVEGVAGAAAVAAGEHHALALLQTGTVMAWGAGAAGQLGDGASPTRSGPVAVGGLSGVSAIAAGGNDSAALLSSGSIMTWGADKFGTLGDGIAEQNSNVPVEVAGIRAAADVSAGATHMLAFGEPIPQVTSVSPNAGVAGGGNTVTIEGTALAGATAVRFGSAEATNLTQTSPTSLTVTAPAGTGTVDVKVTTPSGESIRTVSDRYTYAQVPKITGLSPKSGPVTGAHTVVIKGTELRTTSAVSFGATAATSFKVISETEVSAVAPAHEAGIVNVTVTTAGGTSAITTADHYKYTPVIESLSPSEGPTLGGTEVVVTGAGFSTAPKGTAFKFGTVAAKSVTCTSSTTCLVIAPAHEAGTVTVKATVNRAASTSTSADLFTYR